MLNMLRNCFLFRSFYVEFWRKAQDGAGHNAAFTRGINRFKPVTCSWTPSLTVSLSAVTRHNQQKIHFTFVQLHTSHHFLVSGTWTGASSLTLSLWFEKVATAIVTVVHYPTSVFIKGRGIMEWTHPEHDLILWLFWARPRAPFLLTAHEHAWLFVYDNKHLTSSCCFD